MPPPPDPNRTTAGIVVDPRTLERVVPQSRRKDGSVRKELKIRPGFTPQEDVGRFRSARQLASSSGSGSGGPRLVPGSNRPAPPPKTGELPNPFASEGPGQTRSAAKNERRKEKRREAVTGAGAGAGAGGGKAWDESSDEDEDDGGLRTAFGAAGGAAETTKAGKEEEFPALRGGGKGAGSKIAPATEANGTAPGVQESPATQAFREDRGTGAEVPNGNGTEPDLTARIAPPPGKADVPDTASALRRPSDRPWRSAGPRGPGPRPSPSEPPTPRSQSQTQSQQQRPTPAPTRGRGGSTAPAPAPSAADSTSPSSAGSKPEPRVRKDVRVKEGGANDVSSLAARVRGLVLENESSRSAGPRADRKTAKSTD